MTSTRTYEKSDHERLHALMARHVERGELPGLVTLVGRRGEIVVDAIGAMRRDTIFRIASITKPMAAASALLLVDENELRLDEPVDRLLPELANRRVLKRIDGPLDDTVPAKRAITVRDLLTFEMGFGLIWGPQDAHPIQRAAAELELGAFGPPHPEIPPAPDEWMRRFGTLPLMHQPGERWMYNTSAEVLGVLIARASQQPLERFMTERLFEPLGMKDTAFSVPREKIDRLPVSYFVNPKTDALELYDEAEGGAWSRPPAFPSAGAGLVSTADDVHAFGRMMLDKGTIGKKRLLSAASIEAMTTDQISPEVKAASKGSLAPDFWDSYGWGFGIAVTKDGRFGWDGGLGTSWRSDPKDDLVAILMTQRSEYPASSPIYLEFWSAVTSGSVK